MTYGCASTAPHWCEKFLLILLLLPGRGGVDARLPAAQDLLLHHPNKYGNTLLALTLEHHDLQVSKYLLLKMEREYHSADPRNDVLVEMSNCFRKYLRPSVHVMEALKEVKANLEKIIEEYKS